MPYYQGYTLDLYCDKAEQGDGIHEYNEFPVEYTGEHGSKLRSKARRDGWIIGRNGISKTLCPKCSGKKQK